MNSGYNINPLAPLQGAIFFGLFPGASVGRPRLFAEAPIGAFNAEHPSRSSGDSPVPVGAMRNAMRNTEGFQDLDPQSLLAVAPMADCVGIQYARRSIA